MTTNLSTKRAERDSEVDFDLDLEADGTVAPPFRVRLGGKTFELAAPDAGLVMEIEDARTTSQFLALAFDEQWPDVRPLVEPLRPEVLLKLIREYGQHFDLDQAAMMQQAAPNRAERRRRRRSR